MRHILIIEDDGRQADMLRRFLVNEGFRCEEADVVKNFSDGILRSLNIAYDCIVTDLGLPDEGASEFDIAGRLNELNGQVVALTGSGDPELIAAVRATGASFCQKPGGHLLLEKIWSQINHKRPDRESEVQMQEAQRRIQHPPANLWKSIRENTLAMIAIFGGAASTGAWLYSNLSTKIVNAQAVEHRLENLDRQAKAAEEWRSGIDGYVREIQKQNQISIDDRTAMHRQMDQQQSDFGRRLERIEEKIDRLQK